MDDIFIEISAMKSKASQLQELSRRISCVVNNLNSARFQLADVWKDESFSEFDYEFFREINSLLDFKANVDSMAEICNHACNEYQTADNNILSLI